MGDWLAYFWLLTSLQEATHPKQSRHVGSLPPNVLGAEAVNVLLGICERAAKGGYNLDQRVCSH